MSATETLEPPPPSATTFKAKRKPTLPIVTGPGEEVLAEKMLLPTMGESVEHEKILPSAQDGDTAELPAVAVDPYAPIGGKIPAIGAPCWYIFREVDNGPLLALPAMLYQPAAIGGLWAVNVFRAGYMWYAHSAKYCGSQWENGAWCWPGEIEAK